MSYKNGRWAKQVINLQHKDGSWGYFHSLSQPTNEQPMTTEQALRRLRILGFTAEDEPIRRALAYVEKCLTICTQERAALFGEVTVGAGLVSPVGAGLVSPVGAGLVSARRCGPCVARRGGPCVTRRCGPCVARRGGPCVRPRIMQAQ